MEDNNQNILRKILESPYDEKSPFTGDQKVLDKANFEKMKSAYSMCMNEEASKAEGLAPLQKIVKEFETIFPVADPTGAKKVSSKDELTNALIWLAQHTFTELVSVSVLVSSPAQMFSDLTDEYLLLSKGKS
jgi:hypothetical protein